ncbi:MAG: hypothetical protein A2Z83_09220 [Omnitrophica bacterium GWA2_52_8]|nr:MAG: hypothetical protein A2Z83_09220 [Omnitrophica bacterium GWA2_52_8]
MQPVFSGTLSPESAAQETRFKSVKEGEGTPIPEKRRDGAPCLKAFIFSTTLICRPRKGKACVFGASAGFLIRDLTFLVPHLFLLPNYQRRSEYAAARSRTGLKR